MQMIPILSHLSSDVHTHPQDITVIIVALTAWAFLRYLLATWKGESK